jgi:hypothetical protein
MQENEVRYFYFFSVPAQMEKMAGTPAGRGQKRIGKHPPERNINNL